MKFSKKVLPNELRVITVPMTDNPTVTVLCLVEAGSKYETKEISGLSHFLEHMCFKGTEKRPKSIDIAGELDRLGAEYNAFTAQEFTGYYAKAATRHLDTILDVVTDIYQHSTFPREEMEKEKGVICEEINMYQDVPQKHVQDVVMELLYGDTPAGWNIAGTKETVQSFSRDNFVDYHGKHYVSGKTVVVVSGNINESEVFGKVEHAFASMKTGKHHDKIKVDDTQSDVGITLEYKETDQTHFVLGVRSFDTYHASNPIIRVMSTVLGGGMSSRLFQKVRGEMGAAYYVGAGNDTFTDHGFFQVASGVDSKKTFDVISAILSEMKRLKTEPLSKEELRKAKDYMGGGLLLGLESSDDLAEFYGYQEILRKNVKTADEVLSEIEKVSVEDVLSVANQIFTTERLNCAAVGRYKDEAPFREILLL